MNIELSPIQFKLVIDLIKFAKDFALLMGAMEKANAYDLILKKLRGGE